MGRWFGIFITMTAYLIATIAVGFTTAVIVVVLSQYGWVLGVIAGILLVAAVVTTLIWRLSADD